MAVDRRSMPDEQRGLPDDEIARRRPSSSATERRWPSPLLNNHTTLFRTYLTFAFRHLGPALCPGYFFGILVCGGIPRHAALQRVFNGRALPPVMPVSSLVGCLLNPTVLRPLITVHPASIRILTRVDSVIQQRIVQPISSLLSLFTPYPY